MTVEQEMITADILLIHDGFRWRAELVSLKPTPKKEEPRPHHGDISYLLDRDSDDGYRRFDSAAQAELMVLSHLPSHIKPVIHRSLFIDNYEPFGLAPSA